MAKILRLGWILVREGIITKSQMEQALDVQKKYPDQSIGEVISRLFSIPESQIETIFVKHIFLEVLRNWFYKELQNKMKMNEEQIRELVPKINCSISEYTRVAIRKTHFKKKKDTFEPDQTKSYLSQVHCDIAKVELHTNKGKNIIFDNLGVEYDVQTQGLQVMDPSVILQAKVRLNQLIKTAPPG